MAGSRRTRPPGPSPTWKIGGGVLSRTWTTCASATPGSSPGSGPSSGTGWRPPSCRSWTISSSPRATPPQAPTRSWTGSARSWSRRPPCSPDWATRARTRAGCRSIQTATRSSRWSTTRMSSPGLSSRCSGPATATDPPSCAPRRWRCPADLGEVAVADGERPRDYYGGLGVSRDADADQLQQAYRRQARANHPDVNRDPAAEERFKEINEAYHVLSDPDQRRRYDRFGPDFRQIPPEYADAAAGAGRGGVRGGAGGPRVRVGGFGPDDIGGFGDVGIGGGFGDLFGGVFGGRGRAGPPHGPRPGAPQA